MKISSNHAYKQCSISWELSEDLSLSLTLIGVHRYFWSASGKEKVNIKGNKQDAINYGSYVLPKTVQQLLPSSLDFFSASFALFRRVSMFLPCFGKEDMPMETLMR